MAVVSSLRNVSRGLTGHVLTARIKALLNEIAIELNNPTLTTLLQELGFAIEEKFRETNSQTAVVLGTMENDLVRVQRALQDGQKVSHHMLQEIAVELQKHADFLMHLEGLLLDLGDRDTKP